MTAERPGPTSWRGRPRRRWWQRLLIGVNLVAIVAALGSAWTLRYAEAQASSVNRVEIGGALAEPDPTASGGNRVLNVLLVGSDSGEGLADGDDRNIGRQGERNGDVIMIARLDERAGSISLLALPRDLWGPVQLPGETSPVDRKINAAYAFGGAETLTATITERFGIPIHHFVSVDFAGFADLVAAVGDVSVWFDRPARDFNEATGASQTGFITDAGCHAFGADEALAYVRSRFYQTQGDDGVWRDDANSDLDRIARQQDFVRRLLRTAIDRGARNPSVFAGLVDAGLNAVVIDEALTPALLLDLGTTFRQFEPDELATYALPVGLGRVGSTWVVFEVEADADPVIALFRGVPPDDPATVRVIVRAAGGEIDDPERAERVESVLSELRAAGYAAEGGAPVDLLDAALDGVSVRHNPAASDAAPLLVEVVGGRMVSVAELPPRTIEVLVGPASADPEDSSTAEPSASTTSTPTSVAPGIDATTTAIPATTAVDPASACR